MLGETCSEEEPLRSALPQSNMPTLKNVAVKVPGRNTIPRVETVFIAILSRFVSMAISAVYWASFCAIELKICAEYVSYLRADIV